MVVNHLKNKYTRDVLQMLRSKTQQVAQYVCVAIKLTEKLRVDCVSNTDFIKKNNTGLFSEPHILYNSKHIAKILCFSMSWFYCVVNLALYSAL